MITDSSAWDGNPRLPATWRVLLALLRHTSLSQAELREVTGLSHPIIVQQVARLRRAGLIAFGEPIAGQPGRPPVPMSFNWGFRRLLTLDVHRTGITTQVTDLAGLPLGDAQTAPAGAWTCEALTSTLLSIIRDTLPLPGSPWAAIGLCVPALVSADGRTILDWPGCPGCSGVDLAETLSVACGCPVMLESSANVLASMIATANPDQASSVIAVTVRALPAVHAGVLVDGGLVRGARGRAGELPADHPALSQLLGSATTRQQGAKALGDILGSLATVLDTGYAVLQTDADWSEEETATVVATVNAYGFQEAPRQLVVVPDTPAQTVETLLGLARALSQQVLQLQSGQLIAWADEALTGAGAR